MAIVYRLRGPRNHIHAEHRSLIHRLEGGIFLLRHHGIAARYVSGYLFAGEGGASEESELRAVRLPAMIFAPRHFPRVLVEMRAGDPMMDAHDLDPASVLGLVRHLGGRIDRVLVVGCEPQRTDECIGLSEPVQRAVDEAARLVRELLGGSPQSEMNSKGGS